MSKILKITAGDKFHKLTVIKFLKSEKKQRIWECACDCGKIIEIPATRLCNGLKKSCGCLQIDTLVKRNQKHSLSKTKLYVVFKSIKGRCLNPNNKRYKYYGARGISIYPEWINDPEKFINWVNLNLGQKPGGNYSLDRINNDGNYEPGNLRWATQSQQVKNSRRCLNGPPNEE